MFSIYIIYRNTLLMLGLSAVGLLAPLLGHGRKSPQVLTFPLFHGPGENTVRKENPRCFPLWIFTVDFPQYGLN
ncbi:hypothetical protein HMPREF1631_04910 [Arcanobacterium sp. S3PF19]|nr:hypothetical protein HMPREF1631_04910 [Arcanobacterium sp. S3PF19]